MTVSPWAMVALVMACAVLLVACGMLGYLAWHQRAELRTERGRRAVHFARAGELEHLMLNEREKWLKDHERLTGDNNMLRVELARLEGRRGRGPSGEHRILGSPLPPAAGFPVGAGSNRRAGRRPAVDGDRVNTVDLSPFRPDERVWLASADRAGLYMHRLTGGCPAPDLNRGLTLGATDAVERHQARPCPTCWAPKTAGAA